MSLAQLISTCKQGCSQKFVFGGYKMLLNMGDYWSALYFDHGHVTWMACLIRIVLLWDIKIPLISPMSTPLSVSNTNSIVTCAFSVLCRIPSWSACQLQLRDEYESDKRQALERISSEVEQSVLNMRNSIESSYEHQRDELIQRLEQEQKERLMAMKRRQWVCAVVLAAICDAMT